METIDIKIKPPDKSKPGYLKRRKQAMQINQRLASGDPNAVDEMVDFTLANAQIEAPAGIDLREAIMDLSEEDFNRIFNPADDTVDPTNAA